MSIKSVAVAAITLAILLPAVAQAEMLPSDSIGNDPVKERLCASRAHGKPVPFEIESRYVASVRTAYPDATLIAIDGMSPQLVECHLSEGTGKYGPVSFSPEQNFWHLIRPKQFEPGIHTAEGISMAARVCLDAAPDKINRPNLDHSVYLSVAEIAVGTPRYHPGTLVAGKRAERYDIAVSGRSFYKSSGPDLIAVDFTCLLSPMLNIKAVQLK